MFEQCLLHNPVKDFSDSADRFHTVYIFIYLIITKKTYVRTNPEKFVIRIKTKDRTVVKV